MILFYYLQCHKYVDYDCLRNSVSQGYMGVVRFATISFNLNDLNSTDLEVTDLRAENPGYIGDIFTTYVYAIMCGVL